MTTAANHANGDQRVTNAMIGAKLDRLDERIEEMFRAMREIENRQRCDHDEIVRMKTVSSWWNFGNSIGAIVAAIIGVRQ